MTENRFRVQEHCLRSSYGIEAENWLVTNDNHSVVLNNKAEAHMVANMFNDVIDVLNELHKENKELKRFLKKNCPMCGANLELFYEESRNRGD